MAKNKYEIVAPVEMFILTVIRDHGRLTATELTDATHGYVQRGGIHGFLKKLTSKNFIDPIEGRYRLTMFGAQTLDANERIQQILSGE